MRRIVTKEARDLAPVGLAAAAAAFGIAWGIGANEPFRLPAVALLSAGCGAALGVTQGLLDRRRRDDPFLLHRPVSALRIHAARGAVGAAISAAVAALAVLRADTVQDRWSLVTPGGPFAAPETDVPVRLGLATSLACVAVAVVLHAVARLALAARRPTAAVTLLLVLPTTVLYALLSIETTSVPWLALAAVAGVATTLSSLQLSARSA